MEQIKIFKSVESELWSMENEINEWIRSSGAKVISVTGNIAPQTRHAASQGFSASDVLIIVMYEPAGD